MNVPLWAAELARAFWECVPASEGYPRDLRGTIAKSGFLSVVLTPRLTLQTAGRWLRKCGIPCEFPDGDRPLRACLAARNGHGMALVEQLDAENERRFSIAHELAHFLRDYWSIRRRVSKHLGPSGLQVLDGERPPTAQERLYALIRSVPLGFHLHLMERAGDGQPMSVSIAQAEDDADRLAYELLAPAEHVVGNGAPHNRQSLECKLCEFYGLPSAQAARYAALLLPSVKFDPFILRLRSVMQ